MTTLRRIFTATTLAVAAAGFAGADSITYYYPASNTSPLVLNANSCNAGGNANCVSSIPNGPGDFADFAISQFSVPDGYQLDSVTFSFTGVANSTLLIDNQNAGNITAVGTYSLLFDTLVPTTTDPNGEDGPSQPYQPGDYADDGLLQSTPVVFSVDNGTNPITGNPIAVTINPDSPSNACASGPGSDGCNEYATSSNGISTVTQTYSTPGFLSLVEGDGTLYVPFFVSSSNSLSINSTTGSNDTVTTTSEFAASLDVTYNYSAINTENPAPEPATMALVGGALVGLGLIGKRRVKKS